MKISIACSVLILAIGAGLGWHDRQLLVALEITQKQLAAETVKLEIPAGDGENPGRSTKRKRPVRSAAAILSTAELIELTEHADLLQLYDGLSDLDPAGLKALLAEIAATSDRDEPTRMTLRHCCTTVLANDHPQAALEIFSRSPELFEEGDRGRSLVLTALGCLAKNNLAASLDWVRNHPQHFPEDAKGEIITAVGQQDARLAFQLITELDYKISDYAIRQILDSQKTLAEKSGAVAGLREYLATVEDEKVRSQRAKSAIGALASQIGRESFTAATRWISEQNLTAQEFRQFVEGLNISTTNGETARWIEWLRQQPPGQAADPRIKHLIYQWTCDDYQAAMQWALTQPLGKDRDQILKTIHGNWPKQDPAGKEAFAKEHGIK